MHSIDSCLVCGSREQHLLYPATFHGGSDDAANHFLGQRSKNAHADIVRCGQCGFVYAGQQFENSEYQSIYIEASKRHKDPEKFLAAETVRGARLARLTKQYCSGGELFDLGCGQGGFLKAAKGFQKTGFEVTAMPAHENIDAQIVTGDFVTASQREFKNKSFDIITAFDVFEHLPDLRRYMEIISKLVNQEGILVITVPNYESLSSRVWGRHWGLILLEHLWYFSPPTLKQFVEPFGWERLDIGHVPYDVTLSHLIQRSLQIAGVNSLKVGNLFSKVVFPVPVGLMYSVFRRI